MVLWSDSLTLVSSLQSCRLYLFVYLLLTSFISSTFHSETVLEKMRLRVGDSYAPNTHAEIHTHA